MSSDSTIKPNLKLILSSGNDLPAIPQYNITRLNFRDVPISTGGRRGMAADVSLALTNSYPVKLTIPPLGFDILVENCNSNDNYIKLADATTGTIDVEPYSDVKVDVGGIVREIPKTLVQACPHSRDSPLDLLLGKYIHGNNTTIFVRGSSSPDTDTPEWITKIISSVTVPVPFPGHSFDKVIKEFSLTDTEFFLPDSSAKPGSDEENPQISGTIVVTAGLPKEMNFGINVTRVRANADVFYKGKKLGVLNLHKWQKAQSERIEPKDGEDAALRIKSRIEHAPQYNITRLNFRDVPISTGGRRGMAADVSLALTNSYPVKLTIPPLGFDILVENCNSNDNYIKLADATTGTIDVEPYSDVKVDVGGIVREIPKTLVQACPHSRDSPLDLLLGKYIHGNNTTIFVRGSSSPDTDTPEWITKIISSVTVPVPFPGHSFDKVIKEFSLTDTEFFLPDSSAKPGSDEENPQISGTIVVTAGLPKEMNFGINVTRVRANADVFYKGKKLGVLNLHKWQKAQSERIEPKDGEDAALRIKSRIEHAPLNVTDDDVLTDILMSLFIGNRITLKVVALVDVEVSTVLGEFVVKKLPAEGVVPVKR